MENENKFLTKEAFNSLSPEEIRRIKMTASCTDCESIPKVSRAGEVFDGPNGRYQLMHNGIKVLEDCYYGSWMTELIKLLQGHHEPQEEKAYNEILKYVPQNATMIELGSYWSYYSLWFWKQIVNAQNYMVEPDPNNLNIGKRNFDLNEVKGFFFNAAVGKESKDSMPFLCESDNVTRQIPIISVDDFVVREKIETVELLLCDIQGFELEMLQGATRCLEQGRIRFVVLSTHHHLISKDPLTHQKCRGFIQEHGGLILVEHNISDSYSGDGLIVASFRPEDRNIPGIEVSRNDPAHSLFRELEYDLNDSWMEVVRMKSECETLRTERDFALGQLTDIYRSRSYRLTKPLRRIANLFQKMVASL